jgi:hypothetical protein
MVFPKIEIHFNVEVDLPTWKGGYVFFHKKIDTDWKNKYSDKEIERIFWFSIIS